MYSPRNDQKIPKKYDYSSLTGKYSLTPTSSSLHNRNKSFVFPTSTEFPTTVYSPKSLTEKPPDYSLKHPSLTDSLTVESIYRSDSRGFPSPKALNAGPQQESLDKSILMQRNQEL